MAYLRRLAARKGDRTEYRGDLDYTTFYAQRLSTAGVTADGDARCCPCRRILARPLAWTGRAGARARQLQ